MASGHSRVGSQPTHLVLEPGAVCHLRCPYCPTGTGATSLSREILRPAIFEQILRHLPWDSLFEVSLFNWGEPLLNPHLSTYINTFTRRGIRVVVHTNFSAHDYGDEFMEALVRSGLTHLVASVDGATQAMYEKYRVGGDIRRVWNNLARLVEVRNRLRLDTPQVTYKMLLNRYNQGEVDQARQIAQDLGADFQLEESLGVSPEARDEWIVDSVRLKYGDRPVASGPTDASGFVMTDCGQLWNSLVVNANGDVLPCCQAWTSDACVGNLISERFETIWNNDRMKYLRRFVLDATVPAPDFPNFCAQCAFRYCTYNGIKKAVRED